MKKTFAKERVKTLENITARHESREIEGCHSWRHFAVHQDRGWLLNALGKIRNQVEKVRQARNENETNNDAEVEALLGLITQETLNRLGDDTN